MNSHRTLWFQGRRSHGDVQVHDAPVAAAHLLQLPRALRHRRRCSPGQFLSWLRFRAVPEQGQFPPSQFPPGQFPPGQFPSRSVPLQISSPSDQFPSWLLSRSVLLLVPVQISPSPSWFLSLPLLVPVPPPPGSCPSPSWFMSLTLLVHVPPPPGLCPSPSWFMSLPLLVHAPSWFMSPSWLLSRSVPLQVSSYPRKFLSVQVSYCLGQFLSRSASLDKLFCTCCAHVFFFFYGGGTIHRSPWIRHCDNPGVSRVSSHRCESPWNRLSDVR